MKFHCARCNKDFTTLSERDESRKFALHHVVMDKMRCPYCDASNSHLVPKPKKGKGKGRRGYAGWDAPDRPEPNIIVHPNCQKRIMGSINSAQGLYVKCEGCESVFNCWTGNVDDGLYDAPLVKPPDVAAAKARVAEKERDDELEWLKELRKRLEKVGFSYLFQKQAWYATLGGTTWKLTEDDIESIRKFWWGTPQTMTIKRTFDKRGISAVLAKSLLILEMQMREGVDN